jgi:hypothetical protein
LFFARYTSHNQTVRAKHDTGFKITNNLQYSLKALRAAPASPISLATKSSMPVGSEGVTVIA